MNVRLENNGAHLNKVIIGDDLTLVFSYETCIAFKDGDTWYASVNIWSGTTARHLNTVPVEQKDRMGYRAFQDALRLCLDTRLQVRR